MQDVKMVKNKNETAKLNICIKDNSLIIKLKNSLSSLSYTQLIDCDKRFKAFDSIEEVYSFISSFIEEEKIEIINNKIILKGVGKDIIILLQINHQSLLNKLVNDLKFLLQKPSSQTNYFSSELKINKTIQNEGLIHSLCFLKDKRLVSTDGSNIVIYNRDTYKSDFSIENIYALSAYTLRNGNLASCCGRNINLYEIDGNNYRHIYTLKEHSDLVTKVIELEDNRLCSCSFDKAIRIWDKNYQCIQTLEGHIDNIASIIEINNCIISASTRYEDNSVRIWSKKTYQCIKAIQNAYCNGNYSLSKLKDNTIVLGGLNEIFIIDILSFESKSFKDDQLGWIYSIFVLGEDKILLGNEQGDIICYNLLFNQIISTQSLHNKQVCCIIKSEDNQIFSSSLDTTINIYGLVRVKRIKRY